MDLSKKIFLAGDALILLSMLPLLLNYGAIDGSKLFLFTSGYSGTVTTMGKPVFFVLAPIVFILVNYLFYNIHYHLFKEKYRFSIMNIIIPALAVLSFISSYLQFLGVIG